ncbi:MAG: ParB/RepB/Spo0J family partition protein [Burkholderiales bacterium]|nr:ParB/RepB/Spo0J family partition protein [Burkholderiales bacterium]
MQDLQTTTEATTSEHTEGSGADRFERIDLDLIVPSPTNPRKHFDEEKLRELAVSIRVAGVHQPILVRPLPADRVEETSYGGVRPAYEIVAGERRYRACIKAEQTTIPALIRPLTDAQVVEIQIVENLQRDDLTELEEAEGYSQLIRTTGVNAEEVATRIGRSRAYVYGRLKLLDLCQQARTALSERKITAGHADIIARIPSEKLQLKALKEFTETTGEGDPRMSLREAKRWSRNNVMLRLDQAGFDQSSTELCEGIGACGDCPKRTGAAPELFADVDSPDLCTDPACFHSKEDATRQITITRARDRGQEVIEGREAKEAKPTEYGPMRGLHDVDQVTIPGKGGKSIQLRNALTKEQLKSAVKVFVDPHTKQVKEVVDEAALQQAIAAHKSKTDQRADAKEHAAREEEDRVQTLARRYNEAWRNDAISTIEEALAAGALAAFTPPMLRLLLQHLSWSPVMEESDLYRVLSIPEGSLDLTDEETLKRVVADIPELELGGRVCRFLLYMDRKPQYTYVSGEGRYTEEAPAIEALAAAAGIDLASIKSAARAELEAAIAPPQQQQAATKKPKSKATKTTPAEAAAAIAAELQAAESAPIVGLELGQRVRFKMDVKDAQGKLQKVNGKEGVLISRIGDRGWSVSVEIKGKLIEICADHTELEHVEPTEEAACSS